MEKELSFFVLVKKKKKKTQGEKGTEQQQMGSLSFLR